MAAALRTAALSGALFFAACGGEHEGNANSGGSAGAGTGGGGSGGSSGAAQSCAEYTPQATPAEIASTPRPDEAAELLTLEASGTLVAPGPLYQRVAADMAAIKAQEPFVIKKPLTDVPLDHLRIEFDFEGWTSVVKDKPFSWDCPNKAYGGSFEINYQWQFANVTFGQKRYRGELLEKEYALLAHVTKVSRELMFQDGPDACLEIEGEQHSYIFDDASGDCPAGCINHTYTGFRSLPGAIPTKLGTYDKQGPEPAWFTALSDCRSRL